MPRTTNYNMTGRICGEILGLTMVSTVYESLRKDGIPIAFISITTEIRSYQRHGNSGYFYPKLSLVYLLRA